MTSKLLETETHSIIEKYKHPDGFTWSRVVYTDGGCISANIYAKDGSVFTRISIENKFAFNGKRYLYNGSEIVFVEDIESAESVRDRFNKVCADLRELGARIMSGSCISAECPSCGQDFDMDEDTYLLFPRSDLQYIGCSMMYKIADEANAILEYGYISENPELPDALAERIRDTYLNYLGVLEETIKEYRNKL